MDEKLRTIPIHRSLSRPQLIMGCERFPFLMLCMVATLLAGPGGLMTGNFTNIFIAGALFFIGRAALSNIENVIEMKNGSFLAGFWYEGPDMESATREEAEALSAYISRVLMRLDKGWMLHAEMTRKPAEGYPSGNFSEPTNILVDAERKYFHGKEGRHFETKTALFFTYLPPLTERSGVMKKISKFLSG